MHMLDEQCVKCTMHDRSWPMHNARFRVKQHQDRRRRTCYKVPHQMVERVPGQPDQEGEPRLGEPPGAHGPGLPPAPVRRPTAAGGRPLANLVIATRPPVPPADHS